MNRTDTKFSFVVNELPFLLGKLKEHYQVLKINNTYISSYKTLYFDTNEFQLYLKHHNGSLNRYKVRHRTYVDTNAAFLEVKFKNNKGRTFKNRIKQKSVPFYWNEDCKAFLSKNTPYQAEVLKPVIWVNYQRITLVGKENKERVTIDINLEFMYENRSKRLNKLVIAEVKQGSKIKSPVIKIFKEARIKQESISKYCMAIQYIYPHVKNNNFKEKIHILNKIVNNDHSFKLAAGF